VSSAIGLLPELHGVLDQLPLLIAVGWVVRVPLLSPSEGHEAITRVAWEGLALTDGQRAALIRGVRAPDVSIRGLASFVLSSRQPRHALRAGAATTTENGIRAMRAFVISRHAEALASRDERRRWELVGENLHCIQDSFSPAHADREGARIVRMKHWGPLDRFRGRDTPDTRDEHGFPTDRRDLAFVNGALSEPARHAAAVTRDYLELVRRQLVAADPGAAPGREELEAFLDRQVTGPIP
jgi:hypothetical protein